MTHPSHNPNEPSESVAESPAAEVTRVTNVSQPTQIHTQGVSEIVTPSTIVGNQIGHYRLLAKIGQGGMGAVYKALHVKLDKIVALKVLPQNLTHDPDLIARFEREMKAVGKLEHPHIVRAMDAGEIAGTHYLAMEFVEGSDLLQWVKAHGPVAVPEACRMIQQAASALAAAHAAGLVHRDIKPGNLLYAPQLLQVKVLDLGLALLQSDSGNTTDLTARGQTFGTADYMAPEQWEDSHTVDARTDLYALGCTLFFLLTGRAPYARDDVKSLVSRMKSHLTDAVPDLKSIVPQAPAGVAAICQRLLAKSPDERYQTAQELVEALAPYVPKERSSPVKAPVASVIAKLDRTEPITIMGTPDVLRQRISSVKAPAGKPSSRHWRLIIGCISMCLVTGLGYWCINSGRQPTASREATPKSAVASQAKPADDSIPQFYTPPDFARERAVAEWVLTKGGTVDVVPLGSEGELRRVVVSSQLPADFFHISTVILTDCNLVDADLARLTPCIKLTTCIIAHNSSITTRGLKHLQGIDGLQELNLDITRVDDNVFAQLAFWPQLRRLSLSGMDFFGSGISETGLKDLPEMPRLKHFALGGNPRITDAGLQLICDRCPQLVAINITDYGEPASQRTLLPLAKLMNLEELSCSTSQLTSEGLEVLKSLPHLESLYLRSPTEADHIQILARSRLPVKFVTINCSFVAEAGVGSAGVDALASMDSLEELSIQGNNGSPTDDDLLKLARLPQLKKLMLVFPERAVYPEHPDGIRKYTAAGIQKFHELRPDVAISGDFNIPAEDPKNSTN